MARTLVSAASRLVSTLFGVPGTAALLLLTPITSYSASAPLTPQQTRGKQIYERGESGASRKITVFLGAEETAVPATVVPCANCHGADGHSGVTEAGITPPDITWDHLTKPYGGVTSSGQKRPPYTDRLIRRAVSLGVNSAGQRLFGAMPRYQMLYTDMDDLLAYLKVLGTVAERGVTDEEVHVGVILPPQGAMTGAGQAARAALSAFFNELNAGGGIYARHIVLHSYEPPGAGDPAAGFATFLDTQPLFALVASFLAGAERPFTTLLRGRGLPLVGAFTLFPQLDQPLNPYVFYFYPGVPGEAEALIEFAAKQSGNGTVAVVYSSETVFSGAADVAEAAVPQAGAPSPRVRRFEVTALPTDIARAAKQLADANPRATLLLLPGATATALIRECAKLKPQYTLLLPGSLANASVLEAAGDLAAPSYFAMPSLPTDAAPEAVEEYRVLAARHGLPTHDLPAQWQAIASAQVLVEALKSAGSDLTATRLVAALEQLHDFAPGLTASVSFGPNRRVGLSSARISRLDPATKRLTPAEIVQ
ncbi:MAG TPA: ABC transporter substrate-binding protein [Bryobacteraceae bacterium]|nr:ABC transporter substrate-binding protein [Bryobacteraceae bacterium]